MSSPVLGLAQKDNQVVIKDHPSNPRKLQVPGKDPFWVSKSKKEVAEWFCQRNHQHGQNCFTVKFDKQNGSPFRSAVFTSDNNGTAVSDEIVVGPGNTIYEYRIQALGKDDLDPGGGVQQ
jgi:hypothetical protein